jgi:hypothetical protein
LPKTDIRPSLNETKDVSKVYLAQTFALTKLAIYAAMKIPT